MTTTIVDYLHPQPKVPKKPSAWMRARRVLAEHGYAPGAHYYNPGNQKVGIHQSGTDRFSQQWTRKNTTEVVGILRQFFNAVRVHSVGWHGATFFLQEPRKE